jgi:hypothetical protein
MSQPSGINPSKKENKYFSWYVVLLTGILKVRYWPGNFSI